MFEVKLDGQALTFWSDGDNFVDNETGSVWNILGQATEGPLAGEKLTPIVHANHFWFSWGAVKAQHQNLPGGQLTRGGMKRFVSLSALLAGLLVFLACVGTGSAEPVSTVTPAVLPPPAGDAVSAHSQSGTKRPGLN